MKSIKKMLNVFLIMVMLFTEFSPYVVSAANSDITVPGTKGQFYDPVTGQVSDSSVTVTGTYDTGLPKNQGDITIKKTIEKTNKEGEYTVSFEISGNPVESEEPKEVYVVVVLDKSYSMTYARNKWSSAVNGAKNFAKTLTDAIPEDKRHIALVSFSGNYGNKDQAYNDAVPIRGFTSNNFENVSFGNPDSSWNNSGRTNIEAGLLEAKELFENEEKRIRESGNEASLMAYNDAYKYVVLIGDGEPTLYYDSTGKSIGNGARYDENAAKAAIKVADDIKAKDGINATIFSIGYEVDEDSDAETVLKSIANPDSSDIKYYFNADANAVGTALTKIANSIKMLDAGTDATITDTVGGSFTISNANSNKIVDGNKVELSFKKITDEPQTLEFTIQIDQDLTTGWHYTNDGFTFEYTDANGVVHDDISFDTNPAVYWVQNEYDYKVEYYYENDNGQYVIDNTLTVDSSQTTNTDSAFKNSTLTVSGNGNLVTLVKDSDNTFTFNREASSKTGYEFLYYKNVKGETLANGEINITNKTSDNVIKVYYKKIDLQYTVEHYLETDNGYEIQESDTEIKDIHYGDTATYTSKTYTGYTYISSKDEYVNKNVEVTDRVVTDDYLVIKLYYDKNEYGYVIRYHYEDITDYVEEGDSADYLDTITVTEEMINSHNISGYKYDHMNPTDGSIEITTGDNIIDVYYVKDKFDYTVKHHLQELDGSYTEVVDDRKVYTDVEYNSPATYSQNVYTGYTYVRVDKSNATVPANNDLVINLYYDRVMCDYVINYHYQDITEVTSEPGTAKYHDTITVTQDMINSHNITGYNYSHTNPESNSIVIETNGNVIDVYYVKDKFNYTVKHHLQNLDGTTYTEVVEDRTVYEDVEYGSPATYTKNEYDGYTYVRVDKPNETVPANDDLVINLYYNRNVYNYKVEHYKENLDGTYSLDTTDYYNGVAFGTPITFDENVYTGYTYQEDMTVNGTGTVPANNNLVVELYYNRDLCIYRIEYYYDNNIDNTKTESDSVKYGTIVSDYTDKVITGYKFVRDENKPLNVGLDTNNNVIKVYYEKDRYGYSVEYYYDGVIDSSKTETYTATYLDTIDGYTDNNITGYRLDRAENSPLTITEVVENNVIRVYYVKDNFNYTVEYYLQDVNGDYNIVEDDTVVYTNVEYNSPATYIQNVYTGYTYSSIENGNVTVPANNDLVIKLYYNRGEVGYSVEYYYDGIRNDSKTEVYTGTYLDVIETYTDKVITGYKFDKTENLPLTITEIEEDNVIKVYYVKDKFNYSVEYYYDNIIDETKTEVYTATYIDVIETYTDKVISGYKLDKHENVPLNITEIEENNVIRVYYVKDNFNYKVEHYLENLDGTYTLDETDTYTSVEYNSNATYDVNDYTGYTYNETKTVNKDVTVPANNDLVIKLYYDRNNYSYIVNHYLENILDDEYTLQDTDTYTNIEYGSEATYVVKEYVDYTYTSSEYVYSNELTRVLTNEEIIANKLVPANNDLVINLYYVRNKGNVTVHYVIKDVDTGEYIPFNEYGMDIDGNNTEDFIGIDLGDLTITGKIGTEYTVNGRNPIDYTFVGIYEGDLSNSNLISNTEEYTGVIEGETDLTYVYQAPYGEGEILPPQTGVESEYSSYLTYILFGIMMALTYSYIKVSRKED